MPEAAKQVISIKDKIDLANQEGILAVGHFSLAGAQPRPLVGLLKPEVSWEESLQVESPGNQPDIRTTIRY